VGGQQNPLAGRNLRRGHPDHALLSHHGVIVDRSVSRE
jgi:hypothetical protein